MIGSLGSSGTRHLPADGSTGRYSNHGAFSMTARPANRPNRYFALAICARRRLALGMNSAGMTRA